MGLGHGVGDGEEYLVLYLFQGEGVVVVRLSRLQGRQSDAAAADHHITGAVDAVSTDGTDVKMTPEHVGAGVFVDDVLTVHQLNDRDPQSLSQGLQQGNVRQTLGGLPLGNGLVADAQ